MLKQVHDKIAQWYKENGRKELPWRNTTSAYEIYVSEIMLQQTQVKTVLERFYFPFLKKFPTLEALAKADEEEVLKAWEGLGYYTRARNLHKCAKACSPTLPKSVQELIALPGIGQNTAHAVAAFAYHEKVPVMEANVKRILCRLHCLEEPSSKELWQRAFELLDTNNPYDFNQAMMDIGSMVCTVKEPACMFCPFLGFCKAKEPTRYPKKKQKSIPTKKRYVRLCLQDNSLALFQRKTRFLHGLWGFEQEEKEPENAEFLGLVKHSYSHFKEEVAVYLCKSVVYEKSQYFPLESLTKLALAKVDHKILRLLEQKLQNKN